MILSMTLVAGLLALGGPTHTENNDVKVETPFFCNLKALNATERTEHQQLTERLAELILHIVEIVDGYAFELDARRLSIGDLAPMD